MGVAYQRGMLLYHQHRYTLVADEFRKELSQAPNSALAMSMLALSLKQDGKMEEAIQQAQAAIAADPERAFCHYALACILVGRAPRFGRMRSFRLFGRIAGISKYRRGLRKAKLPALEAIRLDPVNPEYSALMSAIELDLRQFRKALVWADKGLAASATHVRCANLRARALLKLDRIEDARQTVEGALALDPESALTHATSGWTHLKSGEPEKAIEHFTQSARLDPNDVNVHRGLSLARNRRLRRASLAAGVILLLTRIFATSSLDAASRVLALCLILFCYIFWIVRKKVRNRKESD
jgi:tetratricopeptide (TPR) repeat protein